MKYFQKHWLLAVLLSSTLMACSSTDEEVDVVAELTDIESKFEPQVLWNKSVGDGVGDYFSRLQPVIEKGIIYSASRDGITVAHSVDNGDLIWRVDLSDIEKKRGFFDAAVSARVSGGVALEYGKIILGTENGDVFALDAQTGELVWHTTVKGEVLAKPVAESRILVVNTGSGLMVGLDVETGEELWRFETEVPPLTLRGISGVNINSGGVIFGNASGEVTVVILESGQQGWTVEIGEPSGTTELERIVDVDVTPVVFGDKIYAVSANGNLAALDLRSGRVLWKRQYSSYREITIAGNTVYATDTKGHIYAIDRLNGLEKWSNASFTNRGVTGAVSVGNYVVVGDFEGYLHWLDADSGEIVSRYRVDGSGIYVEPIVVNDILYVQTREGRLEAIATPK